MDYTRFLRNSHIFASAVRDILEQKFLKDSSPLPLSISQFHLLKLMAINGRHQVTEIAEFLGVSSAAASKNIDKLEGLGLIVRTSSEGDRRASLLSVSPKGRRLVTAYEELKASRLYPILDNFKPAEIEKLAQLLEQISLEFIKLEDLEDGDIVTTYCLRCTVYLESDCPVGTLRGGCPYYRVQGQSAKSPGEAKA